MKRLYGARHRAMDLPGQLLELPACVKEPNQLLIGDDQRQRRILPQRRLCRLLLRAQPLFKPFDHKQQMDLLERERGLLAGLDEASLTSLAAALRRLVAPFDDDSR